MTSSKSDKIILWGGKENTLIPQANQKEKNAQFEKTNKLQAEILAQEQQIAQIQEKGLKTGMYYLRSRSAVDAVKVTVSTEQVQKENFMKNANSEECETCSA